jgi:DNA-binding phage protein
LRAAARNISSAISPKRSADGRNIAGGKELDMPLTVSFKETIAERLKRDPDFAKALLREGVDALLCEEFDVGKDLLRDYVNATIGFDRLSKSVKIPSKSLMRMLGPGGNPQASNLLAIIAALQKDAGVDFHVVDDLSEKSKRLEKAERARREGGRARDLEGKMLSYRTETYEARMGFEEAAQKYRKDK